MSQSLNQTEGSSNGVSLDDDKRRIEELIRTNKTLKANISVLYRTATAEIARKDKMIAELQSDLDLLLFKRQTARREALDSIYQKNSSKSTDAGNRLNTE